MIRMKRVLFGIGRAATVVAVAIIAGYAAITVSDDHPLLDGIGMADSSNGCLRALPGPSGGYGRIVRVVHDDSCTIRTEQLP